MPRKEWFTAQELAGLPGLPTSDRRVRSFLQKNLAQTLPKGRGEGKGEKYARASLPEETREFLDRRDLAEAAAQLPAELVAPTNAMTVVKANTPATKPTALVPAPVMPMDATEKDRARWLAREMVVRTIEQMAQSTGKSIRQVVSWLISEAQADKLPAAMLLKLREAADERGRNPAERTSLPSAVTLQRWVSAKKAGSNLVPRSSGAGMKVEAWYAPFFALADSLTERTHKKSHELLLQNWRPEWGTAQPSYDAAVRAYKKRSELDKIAGRNTGSALKAKTFYYRRTYEGLAPFSEVHADGWNTHFTAPHPVHGRFVTREIWHAHCVATKYVPPFAIGYTETTDLILLCIRNAVEAGGQIAIWQTDSTKAVKGNARVMDELTGVSARLGLTIVHPQEVGNSQANGIAENFNPWLDREARELATYQNPKVMDERTFVRMKRLTNQMVKAASSPKEREQIRQLAIREGQGIVFDSDAEFLAWIEAKRVKWNNKPHRSLPKITDPDTGRQRHMTPQESLNAAIEAGWQPLTLPPEVLADAFRPHLLKKVTRGTVTPFGGQRYRHPALDALMNQEVQVAVDPDDFTKVWVKDLEGRLLCVAEHVPDVQGRSQTMREDADAKRAAARIRLRERQIEAIVQEIAPPNLLEMDTQRVVVPMNFGQRTAELVPVPTGTDGGADEHANAEENPLEIYLRRRVAEKRAEEAQAELDALARIEAAMNAHQEDDGEDEGGFESAAG